MNQAKLNRKPDLAGLVLLGLLAGYLAILAFGWLRQTPSQEELYSSAGRFYHAFAGIFSGGHIRWWSADFLQGASTSQFFLVGVPLILGNFLIFLIGEPQGNKLLALLALAGGSIGCFFLVRALAKDSWAGFWGGCLYACNAQILLRIANFEHTGSVVAYAFIPYVFFGLLRLAEEGSWRSVCLLAVSLGGVLLSYTKIGLMCLPLAGIFFLWLLWDQPKHRATLVRASLAAIGLLCLMVLPLLLPMRREFAWVAAFSFDNFSAWQQAFSIKNFISVLDRGNALLAGMRPDFVADRGQFYLGAVVLVAVGAVFWRSRKNPEWLTTRTGLLFRLFVGLALISLWLSQGPFTVFSGTKEFLQGSAQAPDWLIAIMWLMTLIPVLLIPMLLPATSHRRTWAALLIMVYLFVPGFLVLEKIPLLQNIRAPWGYWEVGFFTAAVAGALALMRLWEDMLSNKARLPLALLLGAILLVDAGFYLARFFTPGLPAQVFADFDRSQEYLRTSPIDGRVYPLSGRYFYLRIPMQSGRGLNTEASWSHFQMWGMRALLNGANASPTAMQTYMRVAGISHVLLDKQDPFTPPEVQNFYAQFYPTGFDSEYIRVLENRDSLAPAFLAREYLAMDPGTEGLASGFLDLAGKINVVPIELGPNERGFPFLVGSGTAQGEVQLTPEYAQAVGVPFQKVSYAEPRKDPTRMVFEPPQPRQGWLTVTEAWHPDWRAYAGSDPLQVYKAFGGLMAVRTDGTQGAIRFVFEAPRWYDACVWISGLSWLTVLGLFVVMPLPFTPSRWKSWWTGVSATQAASPKPRSSAIGKVLVVVPTYNEKPNIPQVLDQVLALPKKTDVLVVDDGSPDGTAELVRSRPEFGKRVFLLEGQGKQGLGTAYRRGFEWALKNGYGAVVEMDADLSHDPVDIPRLLHALEEGAHLAVGSRYLNGVSVLNWPRSRILISTLGGRYVRTLTGLPLTDPTSGFKAIRAEVLKGTDWQKVAAQGYAFQIELHHSTWKRGFVIQEVPIVFTERSEGHSKMSAGIAWEACWRVLRLAWSA